MKKKTKKLILEHEDRLDAIDAGRADDRHRLIELEERIEGIVSVDERLLAVEEQLAGLPARVEAAEKAVKGTRFNKNMVSVLDRLAERVVELESNFSKQQQAHLTLQQQAADLSREIRGYHMTSHDAAADLKCQLANLRQIVTKLSANATPATLPPLGDRPAETWGPIPDGYVLDLRTGALTRKPDDLPTSENSKQPPTLFNTVPCPVCSKVKPVTGPCGLCFGRGVVYDINVPATASSQEGGR